MTPFRYSVPRTVEDAVREISRGAGAAKFIGGGTNLIDLMKMGVENPTQLININRLPLSAIEEHAGGVRIGALASNTAVANHALIRTRYPVLSQAILYGASQQLRNAATTGGNPLQRTRCYYFYDPSYDQCNKRNPGSGCAAIRGYNRIHAILGASPECIATHPSDMCVALAALDAVVEAQGASGARSIPFLDFHRLPGDTPQVDNNLLPGELITSIDIPGIPFAKHSHYLKVRDRNSYAFALVSVATAVDVDETGSLRDIRIALGGVAHKPWRASKAEGALKGRKPDEKTMRDAAEAELADAKGYQHNSFKIELAKRCIVRGVREAMKRAAAEAA